MCVWFVLFFFFKQKTSYDMRISDWSSDVCSSDLTESSTPVASRSARTTRAGLATTWSDGTAYASPIAGPTGCAACTACTCTASPTRDRKSVGQGKSVSLRVDIGGRRNINKKKTQLTRHNRNL